MSDNDIKAFIRELSKHGTLLEVIAQSLKDNKSDQKEIKDTLQKLQSSYEHLETSHENHIADDHKEITSIKKKMSNLIKVGALVIISCISVVVTGSLESAMKLIVHLL